MMTVRQRWLVLFAAVNLLLLILGWVMVVSPQRRAAATTAAQGQMVEGELVALTESSHHPAAQPPIHTAELYALDTALPARLDEPDLLFELDSLAAASHVKILNLAPQAPVAATTDYTVQPINLSLAGSYFNLTRFLRSLRMLVSDNHGRLIANGPLFAVTSVALSQGLSADATEKGEVATVGMAAYYYGAVGGATAPPAIDTSPTSTTPDGG